MWADLQKPKRFDLSSIEILLAEPPIATRRVLRNALYGLGIRNVLEVEVPLTVEMPTKPSVDMLFVDATDAKAETLRLVTEIRRRSTPFGPFVAIVLTCDAPTEDFISRAGVAGADGVLAKPVSMQAVQDRITALIEARRPWVVTENYIGPDRRQSERVESDPIPTFDVPNTVRRKARQESLASLAEDVESAWQRIEVQQMKRHAFQVAFLTELAAAPPTRGRPGGYLTELERVPVVVRVLIARIRSPELSDLVQPLALGMVDRIAESTGDPGLLSAELPDLTVAAMEILRLCLGVADGDKAWAEVNRSVRGFLKRNQQG
jgi:CheY-like chemotaxis protein/flagellar motor switch/type III secretory pathway protein FliN